MSLIFRHTYFGMQYKMNRQCNQDKKWNIYVNNVSDGVYHDVCADTLCVCACTVCKRVCIPYVCVDTCVPVCKCSSVCQQGVMVSDLWAVSLSASSLSALAWRMNGPLWAQPELSPSTSSPPRLTPPAAPSSPLPLPFSCSSLLSQHRFVISHKQT